MGRLVRKTVANNFMDRLDRLERELRQLKTRPTRARTLAEITQDLGDQRAGRFIATDSEEGDPEDAAFTGTFMSALMQVIADGNEARIAEVVNGRAQFWVGDGKAQAGGGAVQMDEDGILISQYGDTILFGDADSQRFTSLGFAESGLYFLLRYWKYADVELVLNGDFETGDFTNWTTSIVPPGTAGVIDTDMHNGIYSSKLTASSGATQFESAAYAAVSPSTPHLLRFWVREDSVPQADILAQVSVKFYTSGDVYISQTTTTLVSSNLPGWRLLSVSLTTPATAAKAKILVYLYSDTFANLYLDDISLRELELVNEIRLTDDGIEIPENKHIPTGTILMHGGSAPDGFLNCDGSAVSRTTYAALFAVIGTTFGAGDGSTTFNTPDLQGRAPVGLGSGSGLTARTMGATGGAETHQLTEAEMPAHTHDTLAKATTTAFGAVLRAALSHTTGTNTTIATDAAGSDAAHNNMQPFAVVRFVIKY